MKTKFVILSLLLIGVVANATAQTKDKLYNESWKDNWFIGIGVGGQVVTNEDNKDHGFGHAITPAVGLSVGHWINPVWGFRGQLAGWEAVLYSDNGKALGAFEKYKKHVIKGHADAVFNISNAIAGYKADRLFTLSAFAGPGLTVAKSVLAANSGNMNVLINGSLGLMGLFNVNDHWDVSLEVRGGLAPSIFKSVAYQFTDGSVTALAGVAYTFGGKKFSSVNKLKSEISTLNDEVNRYRSALAAAQSDLEKAKDALRNVKPQTVEVTKESFIAGPRAIFFPKGKAVAYEESMVNVQMAAEIMKAHPNKKYKIAGYADKATGTPAINKKLSEERAKYVFDALVKHGVKADQMECVSYGGVDDMFQHDNLNRVVIME